jgi:hypothetical protein
MRNRNRVPAIIAGALLLVAAIAIAATLVTVPRDGRPARGRNIGSFTIG